ncbi:hypothetical protein FGL86_06210 [Pistricoccus aurantiacus]|uniref:Uncharacterized protein n=1 Tax=Pistricoccus aurantiacus TaxID=1883414 RepID=A0A5B8SNR7_9GAMM|nr:hypothetical protein [Pistricoccus aurantiacus]QEA38709.1 hypothetical protein FGL86_06210 [Pistricoccus aurantiacus]
MDMLLPEVFPFDRGHADSSWCGSGNQCVQLQGRGVGADLLALTFQAGSLILSLDFLLRVGWRFLDPFHGKLSFTVFLASA